MEEDKDGTKRNIGGGKGNRQGTPQGGVISPLLANLYLHLVDRIWDRRELQRQLGARMVRYADDMRRPLPQWHRTANGGLAVSAWKDGASSQ